MKLYHSSTVAVANPDTVHSRDYLDFGKGFYLTSIYDQAIKYAQRFILKPALIIAETENRLAICD